MNKKCPKCFSEVLPSIHNEFTGYKSYNCQNPECKALLDITDLTCKEKPKNSNDRGESKTKCSLLNSYNDLVFGKIVYHRAFPYVKAVVIEEQSSKKIKGQDYIRVAFSHEIKFSSNQTACRIWLCSKELLHTNQDEAIKLHNPSVN